MAYLILDIPVITLLLNIFGVVSLAFLYPATLRQRIISSLFIYSVSVFSEAIVLIFTNYISFSFTEKGYYDSLFGIICTPFLLFVFAILYKSRQRRLQSIPIPFSYMASVLIIPVSFIIMTVFLFSFVSLRDWQIAFIITLLFIITFGAYLLYERQIVFFSNLNDLKILEAQNSYYKNQLEIIKDNNENIKRLEHDIKNHLVTISSLTEMENLEKTQNYIHHLQNEFFKNNHRIDTGNPVIDGIINVKSSIAQENETPICSTLQLPASCPIDDVDATILLGNILDNAIENSFGEISLTMRYTSGRLFIACSNPFTGKRKKSGNFFLSTKDDPSLHGYGYKNMLRITEKYDGSITCEDSDGIFQIRVLLFLVPELRHLCPCKSP